MDTFINDSILFGIKRYLNEEDYGNYHIFEEHVIKMLVSIYKEADIINPYRLNNSKQLIDNLCIYGLSELEANRFVDLLRIYDIWLNSNRKSKNNLFEEISKILIKMIILKSNYLEITLDELKLYDNFFNLTNSNIRAMVNMSSINPGIVPNLWKKKKNFYFKMNNSLLKEAKPRFLPRDKYESHGLNTQLLNNLSYEEIEKINARILEEETKSEQSGGGRKKEKPKQLILTSGSGFVDTLVLLSIMVTEIMLGIVVTVFLMGR